MSNWFGRSARGRWLICACRSIHSFGLNMWRLRAYNDNNDNNDSSSSNNNIRLHQPPRQGY